jgi:hypothetical protein
MNIKVKKMKSRLNLSFAIIITLFFSFSFLIPGAQSIPVNKQQCSLCHASGGAGTVSTSYLDGQAPVDNVFSIRQGESVSIVVYGRGGESRTGAAVSIIFDNAAFHHLTIKGATAGGEGSNAFYVKDGDENDEDPSDNNIRGVFQITADSFIAAQDYSLTASYTQPGPSGANVDLTLRVEGTERQSVSLFILGSPNEVFAGEESVLISGGISPPEAGNFILEYKTEESWNNIAIITPGNDGEFLYEWTPNKIEEYSIRTRFSGNDEFNPAESQIFTLSAAKSPEFLLNQVVTGVLYGIGIILIGTVLFYRAGRSRYLKQVSKK